MTTLTVPSGGQVPRGRTGSSIYLSEKTITSYKKAIVLPEYMAKTKDRNEKKLV